MTWANFTRRTEDPKLAYIERLLTERDIPHRRDGHSFHTPILQVPAVHESECWAMLNEDIFGDGRRFDEIPDDDAVFANAVV